MLAGSLSINELITASVVAIAGTALASVLRLHEERQITRVPNDDAEWPT